MFILRKLDKDVVTTNISLGNEYKLVDYQKSPDQFKDLLKRKGYSNKPTNLYCFVIHELGQVTPLWDDAYWYIMTSTGQTFENISHRSTKF